MRPTPPRRLPGGLLVTSAFLHDGPARLLVHRLKYDGITRAADVLAEAMVEVTPAATALVPIPRVLARRLHHGVDAARALAMAIGRNAGIPVVQALDPPIWARRHAGRRRTTRTRPDFRRRCLPPPGAVLVDDVVTTGSTLRAAASALSGTVGLAVCATSVAHTTQVDSLHGRWSSHD